MGANVTVTYVDMVTQLQMSEQCYIKATRTYVIRPKLYLKGKPSEIRVNNYMKHCLEFWCAYHDVQPTLDPYAVAQYMLSYH